ncbi:MAG: DUF3536 domain-containing protein [Nanobdellota archaeon]
MNRFLCIHGHFYQPPRENPWLEEIELQDSAYPFHDWNEKITEECYAPNAYSRIKDTNGYIVNIVNNYSKMSFNFGPTLLSWMQANRPAVYSAILEADRMSQERFGGHGSAMAQVYNHMIMPLANKRDKITQVRWGIKDFESRFGRFPEGMWLPETAVDTETLQVFADHGIRFVLLAPSQAEKMRHKEGEWEDVSEGIDPRKPYFVRLSRGKSIAVFFYDGFTSQELAFNDLLENGERFANRLVKAFDDKDETQLVHIATDGETYGHHRMYGDMTLAYAMHHFERHGLARITNYGEYLELFPPEHEVVIKEKTSWSCMHGIKRWYTDCGCNSGMKPGWNQKWREPLRNAMDHLRDRVSDIFEEEGKKYLKDPWEARNDYIKIILDREIEVVDHFFESHASHHLNDDEKRTVLKLLEMQRHAMLQYTSCGWFFDELSGIETVQVMEYAARVIQLAREISNQDFEGDFVGTLAHAPSNVFTDGSQVYHTFVKPAFVDIHKIGAHYAISSVFSGNEKRDGLRVFSYRVLEDYHEMLYAGKLRLHVGKANIYSEITWDERELEFAVLWLGDHNVIGGVKEFRNHEEFTKILNDVKGPFDKADIQQVIKLINDYFGSDIYSLKSLFKDEQRSIVNQLLKDSVSKAESLYREIFEDNYTITTYMHELGIQNLNALQVAADVVINADIKSIIQSPEGDLGHLKKLCRDVEKYGVTLDEKLISLVASARVYDEIKEFLEDHENRDRLERIVKLLQALYTLPLNLNLWQAQNIMFSKGRAIFDGMSGQGVRLFEQLNELLHISFEND